MKDNTIRAQSGHTLYMQEVKFEDLPENVKKFEYIENCTGHRIIRNWDETGHIFMYMAKSKNQYLIWYPKGEFWTGFGKTMQEAIDEAQKAGWMYA